MMEPNKYASSSQGRSQEESSERLVRCKKKKEELSGSWRASSWLLSLSLSLAVAHHLANSLSATERRWMSFGTASSFIISYTSPLSLCVCVCRVSSSSSDNITTLQWWRMIAIDALLLLRVLLLICIATYTNKQPTTLLSIFSFYRVRDADAIYDWTRPTPSGNRQQFCAALFKNINNKSIENM